MSAEDLTRGEVNSMNTALVILMIALAFINLLTLCKLAALLAGLSRTLGEIMDKESEE